MIGPQRLLADGKRTLVRGARFGEAALPSRDRAEHRQRTRQLLGIGPEDVIEDGDRRLEVQAGLVVRTEAEKRRAFEALQHAELGMLLHPRLRVDRTRLLEELHRFVVAPRVRHRDRGAEQRARDLGMIGAEPCHEDSARLTMRSLGRRVVALGELPIPHVGHRAGEKRIGRGEMPLPQIKRATEERLGFVHLCDRGKQASKAAESDREGRILGIGELLAERQRGLGQ